MSDDLKKLIDDMSPEEKLLVLSYFSADREEFLFAAAEAKARYERSDRYRIPTRWEWFRADLWALVTPLLRCIHRSHRLGLPCLRHFAYSRLCRMHGMCDFECPRETRRG